MQEMVALKFVASARDDSEPRSKGLLLTLSSATTARSIVRGGLPAFTAHSAFPRPGDGWRGDAGPDARRLSDAPLGLGAAVLPAMLNATIGRDCRRPRGDTAPTRRRGGTCCPSDAGLAPALSAAASRRRAFVNQPFNKTSLDRL